MKRYNPIHKDDDALPPQDVRFTETKIEPWPDGRRVRVHVRMTPFQSPPNLIFSMLDPQGEEIASALIIENIEYDLVITMHIRNQPQEGNYTLNTRLEFPEAGLVDQASVLFSLPEPPEATE